MLFRSIENSVVGPHVSIGESTIIRNSRIWNSIIQKNCQIENLVTQNSMLGNSVQLSEPVMDLSLGDFSSGI